MIGYLDPPGQEHREYSMVPAKAPVQGCMSLGLIRSTGSSADNPGMTASIISSEGPYRGCHEVGALLGNPCNKDHNMLGPMLGGAHL